MNTHLDFRPSAGPRKKKQSGFNFVPIAVAVIALMGLMYYHNTVQSKITELNAEIEEFQGMGTQYDAITEAYERLEARQARLQQTLSLADSLTEETIRLTNEIDATTTYLLGSNTGGNRLAYVETIELAEGAPGEFDNAAPDTGDTFILITLSGVARSPDAIASFVTTFEDNPEYEATVGTISRTGSDRYLFDLELVSLVSSSTKPSEVNP